MLRVALTGGIGSGKSTAAGIFAELGCFVSQSDEVARSMMQPGRPVYRQIVERFGKDVLLPEGALNRAVLARIAFAEGRAEELNQIVHPAVIAAQTEWMHGIGRQHSTAVAMVESALIFETKHGAIEAGGPSWRSRFDRIVLVTAPEEMRVRRWVDRHLARESGSTPVDRGVAEADARARMRAQLPEEQKARLADAVIPNDGTLADLRAGVQRVWQTLRDEAAVHVTD